MNKIHMAAIFLSTISCVQISQAESECLQKINAIENLYTIKATELSELLGSITPTPLIAADELKQEMSSSDMVVVNVLPEKYHNDCHIAGSINAPLPEIIERAAAWDPKQKIVVYCALDRCDAGEKAALILTCIGFSNVIDYKGGIKEWYQLGYPTQGPAACDYLHTRWNATEQDELDLYPETIVCSQQVCWINRYREQKAD